jgi:APA family basic amino acid/polyamine antiporter
MSSPVAAAAPRTLQRQIGLWSAIAVVIGSTIGSGIFRSPAGIADKLPGPLPMLLSWVAGGIFAICGALTVAELASALPRTGGIYVFLRQGWGKLPAFLFGWGQLVMIRAASLGAIAITCAEYFFRVMGWSLEEAMPVRYAAAAAILLTATFNIVGVRVGALFTNVTVVAKYGGLLFIIIVAFALGLPETGGYYTPAMPPGSLTVSAFGLALVSTLWAFDGWADLAYNGGEVKDPQRTLPRALIGGTLMVVAIYILANLAYLAVLPIEEIRVSRLVAADVAEKVIGPAGVVFVSVTVMVSTFGALNAVLFTSPRIFFAMAEDGLFFKPVAAVHPKLGTPWVRRSSCCGPSNSSRTRSSPPSCPSTSWRWRRSSGSGSRPTISRASAAPAIRWSRGCSCSRCSTCWGTPSCRRAAVCRRSGCSPSAWRGSRSIT